MSSFYPTLKGDGIAETFDDGERGTGVRACKNIKKGTKVSHYGGRVYALNDLPPGERPYLLQMERNGIWTRVSRATGRW